MFSKHSFTDAWEPTDWGRCWGGSADRRVVSLVPQCSAVVETVRCTLLVRMGYILHVAAHGVYTHVMLVVDLLGAGGSEHTPTPPSSLFLTGALPLVTTVPIMGLRMNCLEEKKLCFVYKSMLEKLLAKVNNIFRFFSIVVLTSSNYFTHVISSSTEITSIFAFSKRRFSNCNLLPPLCRGRWDVNLFSRPSHMRSSCA